jgi:type II secretory pathway pseudopilin PulG
MIKIIKNNKGFSLAEIIIVVGIFSATIGAIFSLVLRNISVQKHNEDYLVASMLAQEGLELVRNLRDKNWLIDPPPVDGAWEGIVPTNPDEDYIVDYDFNVDHAVDDIGNDGNIEGEAGCRLYINALGYYSHVVSTNPTKYYRIVKINDDMPNDKLEVTVVVQWADYYLDNNEHRKTKIKEYQASTVLYDWR